MWPESPGRDTGEHGAYSELWWLHDYNRMYHHSDYLSFSVVTSHHSIFSQQQTITRASRALVYEALLFVRACAHVVNKGVCQWQWNINLNVATSKMLTLVSLSANWIGSMNINIRVLGLLFAYSYGNKGADYPGCSVSDAYQNYRSVTWFILFNICLQWRGIRTFIAGMMPMFLDIYGNEWSCT